LVVASFPPQDTLIELRLTDNLLGDSLNPIFSTIEFQALNNLQVLDLSGNKIKAIEEGILKGCTKLSVSLTDGFLIAMLR
jgi:Leucine-rich repeat (LRR) protein